MADFYEASDWATAVCAAEALDIAVRRRHAGILNHFTRLSERLAVTVIDRKRIRLDLSEPGHTDVDDDAAAAVVKEWHERLGVPMHPVPDPE